MIKSCTSSIVNFFSQRSLLVSLEMMWLEKSNYYLFLFHFTMMTEKQLISSDILKMSSSKNLFLQKQALSKDFFWVFR